jgi:tetratricopeptide (TPR) repeat protein
LAIKLNKQIVGDKHPNLAYNFLTLSSILELKNDYEETIRIAELALAILHDTFGENNLHVAFCYGVIAKTYYSQQLKVINQNEIIISKILNYYLKCLSIRLYHFGEYHPDVSDVLESIYRYYSEFEPNNFQCKLKYLEQRFKIEVKLNGFEDYEAWELFYNITFLYYKIGEDEKLFKLFIKYKSKIFKTISMWHYSEEDIIELFKKIVSSGTNIGKENDLPDWIKNYNINEK